MLGCHWSTRWGGRVGRNGVDGGGKRVTVGPTRVRTVLQGRKTLYLTCDRVLEGATVSAMRTNGVRQPDNRSCIPSCIATFLGLTELKYPLQKVGRNGNLVESDNETLQCYGCKIEKCPSTQIPGEGDCLVLATHPNSGNKHCFLFQDGELEWDPSQTQSSWPNGWRISEVWKIEPLPAEVSQTP